MKIKIIKIYVYRSEDKSAASAEECFVSHFCHHHVILTVSLAQFWSSGYSLLSLRIGS